MDKGDAPNVRQAVPFFGVREIDVSLRHCIDGPGFAMTIDEAVSRSDRSAHLREFDVEE
jgi:hypothetical protein